MFSINNNTDQGERSKNQKSEEMEESGGSKREGQMADIEKARQEKKRNREQQRRNALNDGLDRLLELIFEIDPNLKAEAEIRARQSSYRGRIPSIEHCLLSRVEILDHGIMTLRRIHRENEDRKLALARMSKDNASPVPAAAAATAQAPPNHLVNHLVNPTITNTQDIQALQQQLHLRALLAASSPAAPPGLANLQASLGLGGSMLPHLQGSALIDLVLQARNSAAGAASLLALHQSDSGGGTSANSNHSLLNSDLKSTLPGDSSFYRALLDRKIREEETTAPLQNAYAMRTASLFGAPQPTSEREPLGLVASEALQGARAREQTIAEAAAAANTRRLHHGPRDEYSPASKRMKQPS
jgi:hypothetical protein